MDTAPLIKPAHHIITYKTKVCTDIHMRLVIRENLIKPVLTCCLKVIFSSEDFFIKLDKYDNGKTKAALPSKISPISIELAEIDNPGLQEIKEPPDKDY